MFLSGDIVMVPHVKFGFILLLILLIALGIFAASHFRLNRLIGSSFFFMYIAFVVYAYMQDMLCDYDCRLEKVVSSCFTFMAVVLSLVAGNVTFSNKKIVSLIWGSCKIFSFNSNRTASHKRPKPSNRICTQSRLNLDIIFVRGRLLKQQEENRIKVQNSF